LVKEVLDRLAINSINPTLYVTFPPNLEKRLLISEFKSYTGDIQFIQLKENRGRDIGPFFSDLPDEFFANHNFVAHVHTKKSLDFNNHIIGRAWADFCLDNLIGFGQTPMMDKVVKHFVENKKVGIIYPDDPNVMGWGENYKIAIKILESENVPKETELFDFPIGNFFFARPAALEHLLSKNFEINDWPEEPIPYDGTILHALERLIGIVPMTSGFTTSVTNVKALSR
jgi:lipopolysaccharide biosynthesis protein